MKYQDYREVIKCTNCGAYVNVDVSFCEKCGEDLLKGAKNKKANGNKIEKPRDSYRKRYG